MKKSRLLGAVCACTILFVFTSSNAAVLVDSSTLNVIDTGGLGFTNVEVSFFDNNPIFLSFENGGLLEDDFNITVNNFTGTAWTDFKFEFSNASILVPLNVTPSTGTLVGVDITATTAWLFFDPAETIALSGAGLISTSTFGFVVAITPNAVPVPAAVWLFGSGLLGLIGLARRKKA